MSGIMNNYFYGKAGKKDFTVSDLPANRYQLFKDVLKVRWGSLISLNLLYLIIWIPAAVWTAMNIGVVFNAANAGETVDLASYMLPYLVFR